MAWMLLRFLLFFLASSSSPATVLASSGGEEDGGGLTHIHFYLHEVFKGPNATAVVVVPSPLGANSSFGLVGVNDHVLRAGRDAASAPVGRLQGIFVGTGLEGGANFLTSFTLVFTAGEHRGSTLSVQGPLLGFKGAIERPVVGGTGKFRMARGYSLMTFLGNPTPETGVFEFDLFVHLSKYY